MHEPSAPAADLLALERLHAPGVYPARDRVFVRGAGALLYDADGREYVDCAAGQGVAALGHAHPRFVAAVARQAETLVTCSAGWPNDKRAELGARLAAYLPLAERERARIFWCNSGTEAVEGALKIARLSTGRTGVVALERGFHGRTFGALSATWSAKYRDPFLPLVPGFVHVPPNDVAALERAVTADVACVILEIVQGEGGVHVLDRAFLDAARRLCTERGALLVVDEIQTGFGRTGRMFACEHVGLEPDLLCLGKAIGGGVPMGAVAIGPRVAELPVGVHGSTFGGNPLACAAGLAVLDAFEHEGLVDRAQREGARLAERLRALGGKVREVRGLGLMLAVEIGEPSGPALDRLVDLGVIAISAGPTGIRLLPPLVATRADLERAVDALAAVVAA